ncbi:MAG: hypothetical protein JGK38_23835 [Microcoleus sp. PH2017_15_JOR_U_A]|uniref:hypothetical protein n=1 Tax=unclassified Microcoleus TaxID=2642155 RepID=UPI001E0A56F4|nr:MULTISPECIES: hypothetical protein [unclassified Microcoleus]MCC3473289.1 hypothetical protein [Microcoleus sp. PH2017_13_LAR_U_A]MCC3486544.1 hypothetical protein [Microcoleus sp. PH2017_14_LAR_D_A]MCC3499588.1 hypothetical protein [Microcoleus sp. PH2017_15_JOR_U_A]MCC3600160.1 hypothetical protein [Microcoleus sp. PH2017_26_ELK_O_A]MCC3623187.1 hypothetical protein [Microcoleus sp. PH2017_36_ELK_O_B]
MSSLPRCLSFFEGDDEYPDLGCRELAVDRYLRLIYSADYRSKPFVDDDPDREGLPSPTNNLPLPPNVITIGRRVTPALRVKILGALDLYPTKGQIRIYQLFAEIKACGFKYDHKHSIWEFRSKWKNSLPNKN